MRISALIIINLLLIVANLYLGAVSIPADSVTSALFGTCRDETIDFIIWQSRFPTAITALLAGSGLAASGLMLQTLFRNPLAGPSVLGITSGASLGVALVMLLFGGALQFGELGIGGNVAVDAGALAGSLGVTLILLVLSGRVRNNLLLLIVGMMISYLASSLVTLLSSLTTARGLKTYVNWGFGTFSNVATDHLPGFTIIVVLCLVASILLAKPLNLLLLGDNYASNLGVNVKRVRTLLLTTTCLLSGIITAACGPIGFVGLATPHIARLMLRTDNHLLLMPATVLTGSALALACNLGSMLNPGNVIPINALTPIAGVPVVIYILLKKR